MELKVPAVFVHELFENPNGYIEYRKRGFRAFKSTKFLKHRIWFPSIIIVFSFFPFLVHVCSFYVPFVFLLL